MIRPNDQRKDAILKMLPLTGGVTAAVIEERLRSFGIEVTRRTLERDLGELTDTGQALATNTKPRQYSRSPSHPIGLTRGLEPAEAVVLQLAESHLRRLLPAHMLAVFDGLFEDARASLRDSGMQWADGKPHTPLARWADLVKTEPEWLPRIAPAVRSAVSEAVSEALLRGRQLKLRYRTRRDSEFKESLLSPLGLVQRGPVTFLVVTQRADRDPFLLAMHRIAEATMLEEDTVTPAGFDLSAWLTAGSMLVLVQRDIRLVLAVSGVALLGLQEAPLAVGQTITRMADGRHRLTVRLPHSLQLEWWVLGMGDNVELLAPKRLRAIIKTRLRSASYQY